MSKNEVSAGARQVVTIPPDVAAGIRAVSAKVGSPSIAYLATAGLRRMIYQINKGEIALVNGEFQPVARRAETPAA